MMWFLLVYALYSDGSSHLAKVKYVSSEQQCRDAVAVIDRHMHGYAVGDCLEASKDDLPQMAPPPKGYKRAE